MRLVFLTPGTGSYYCGVCMRDNALVKQLVAFGEDAVLLPAYLPLTLEESAASPQSPVFFGGLRVYLKQRWPWISVLPEGLLKLLDAPGILRMLGRFSGMTGGSEVGELTWSMLRGEQGAQASEVDALVDWLRREGVPGVVWLSTALLSGVARRIQQELGVPVMASLQGEDSFLDGLPEPWRTRCWAEIERRCAELDGLVAPSCFFARLMERRFGWVEGRIRVIPNGISLEGYAVSERRPTVPTVGYLARLCRGKGLEAVVEAFLELRRRGRVPNARLVCIGTQTAEDGTFLEELRTRIGQRGLMGDVEFHANVTREQKVELLQGLSLLSVPAMYGEAFGLYLIEAMACGVPVVQPETAAFPEIVGATGAGLLVTPGSAESLAQAWESLLLDPRRAREMGQQGRQAVERDYSMPVMAGHFLDLSRRILDGKRVSGGERRP